MANVPQGDPPWLHIVLERVDPARKIARYYVRSVEPTLFAKHTLIRRWGRIGCLGRERLQFFGGEDASRAKERTCSPCPALSQDRLQLNSLVIQSGFAHAASPKQTAVHRREEALFFVLPVGVTTRLAPRRTLT
jgi:predicted DNA-binding WGR domain protein